MSRFRQHWPAGKGKDMTGKERKGKGRKGWTVEALAFFVFLLPAHSTCLPKLPARIALGSAVRDWRFQKVAQLVRCYAYFKWATGKASHEASQACLGNELPMQTAGNEGRRAWTREVGHGTRDPGPGTRDGTRDTGHGTLPRDRAAAAAGAAGQGSVARGLRPG